MYIDVHCHLDLVEKETDLSTVVDRAKNCGVKCIVTNGVNVETNRKTLDLAVRYKPTVKACLGVYPVDALAMKDSELLKEIEFIRENVDNIIGIGEVGMDFKEADKKDKQEKIFKQFISLSIELDIPITVHSRKAEEECIEILEKLGATKVIMHYFSGKLKLIERIVKNGWFLSIPTAVKNSQHFQEVIKLAPIENLLCETDSPYSHPDKEFPNTSENIVESYKKIAEIKNTSLNKVEKKIEDNFKRLFSL